MSKWRGCAALCWLLSLFALTVAKAQDSFEAPAGAGPMGTEFTQNYSPAPWLSVGIGGSYNSVKFEQKLAAAGTSNVYSGSTLVAYGEAGGPVDPLNTTETTFAPLVQATFLQNSASDDWVWGAKFSYKYLGTNFTDRAINAPQYGSFTNTLAAPGGTTFTGHVIIGSSQTTVDHELALMPFLGHAFDRGYAYFGAGPVVYGTKSNLYDAIGFADMNGTHVDITGQPIDFSDSNWMWGGAAQVGLLYQLGASCYLDVSYQFAVTAQSTIRNSSPFASETQGYTDTGILYTEATQRLTVGSLHFSINKAF